MSFDDGNPCAAGRGQAGYRGRLARVRASVTHVRVRVLFAGSPSRSSRLTSRDGQRFEERHPLAEASTDAEASLFDHVWVDEVDEDRNRDSAQDPEASPARAQRERVTRQERGDDSPLDASDGDIYDQVQEPDVLERELDQPVWEARKATF